MSESSATRSARVSRAMAPWRTSTSTGGVQTEVQTEAPSSSIGASACSREVPIFPGGEKGIRTPGTLTGTPDFESILRVAAHCDAWWAKTTRHASQPVETFSARKKPVSRTSRSAPPDGRERRAPMPGPSTGRAPTLARRRRTHRRQDAAALDLKLDDVARAPRLRAASGDGRSKDHRVGFRIPADAATSSPRPRSRPGRR
jgi:hypothetical protein